MDDDIKQSNREKAAEIRARKEKMLSPDMYKKEAPSYRKQLNKHLDYLGKTNESRAHKQLATFFKNKEVADRAFNKKPEEQKEVPKMTEPKKIKEANVSLKNPPFKAPDQEPIMNGPAEPQVAAAADLSTSSDKSQSQNPDASMKTKKKVKDAAVKEAAAKQGKIISSYVGKNAETPKSNSSAGVESGMAKARALAQKGMAQMTKLNPKMERHLAYALGDTYKESLQEELPVHALDAGPETFSNGTVSDSGSDTGKTYTEDLAAGDLVQCLKTNRVGKVVSCDGNNCTVEFYPGTEKSEMEHGHPDWYQKLTDTDPQHFHTARSTTDATDYPHYESANLTGEVLTEGTKEGERSWHIKGLKQAGHGIIGKKVRSYDFPGFNDAHYMEGHVVHETPYSYHVRTTKVVRSGKEHPIGVHNQQFEAPKGKHLFYGAAGVYHVPKEGRDVNGADNPRARRTFGTMRVSTHQKK